MRVKKPRIVGKFTDKKWLEEQYLNKGKSEYDIADECSVSRATIWRWRTFHQIPTLGRQSKKKRNK